MIINFSPFIFCCTNLSSFPFIYNEINGCCFPGCMFCQLIVITVVGLKDSLYIVRNRT